MLYQIHSKIRYSKNWVIEELSDYWNDQNLIAIFCIKPLNQRASVIIIIQWYNLAVTPTGQRTCVTSLIAWEF